MRPGMIFKHFRNKLNYEIIDFGINVKTMKKQVIYKSLYDHPKYKKNTIWIRDYESFTEKVDNNGYIVNRFQHVK